MVFRHLLQAVKTISWPTKDNATPCSGVHLAGLAQFFRCRKRQIQFLVHQHAPAHAQEHLKRRGRSDIEVKVDKSF